MQCKSTPIDSPCPKGIWLLQWQSFTQQKGALILSCTSLQKKTTDCTSVEEEHDEVEGEEQQERQ